MLWLSFVIGSYLFLIGECGVVKLTGISGAFESPKAAAGKTYPNDLNQTWIIETSLPGRIISLYFSRFELEDSYESDKGSCVYDYLQIDESGNKTRFCGSSSRGNYDAPQIRKTFTNPGKMEVTFITDYSNEDPLPRGFKAHYTVTDRDECSELEVKKDSLMEGWDELLYCNHQCINLPGSYTCACELGYKLHENKHTCVDDCGQTLYTADTDTILPKLYRNKYSKLSNCNWKIKARPGINVHLKFTGKFDIEEHYEEGCVYDWLQVKDHTGTLGQKFCGKSLPNNGNWIYTNSHDIDVHFVTDLSVEMEGFFLKYKLERVKCNEVLVAPDKGELATTSSVFEGKATYTCDIGYKLIGDPTRICQANGQWTGTQPLCQIKKCGYPNHLKDLKNGRILTKNVQLEYGSIVETACYIWYELRSGSQKWNCGDDEKWHPEVELPGQDNIPECKLLCGLKGNTAVMNGTYDFGTAVPKDDPDVETGFEGKIIGGKPARRGEWPWMAFLNIPGFDGLEGTEDICGGTLVSDEVVITAAHCFDNWVYESTRVYIGAHDRQNATDEALQVFSVKDLHIHPFYNGTTEENDIAVIILNKKVKIGMFARPICIPTREKEKELPMRGSAKLQGYHKTGVVSGWGQFEMESEDISRILLMVRLEAIPHDKCYSDFENTKPQGYHDSNVTIKTNMICAGNLLRPQDSCYGDSGGPFTFKDMVTSRWFLNGIVSFGSTYGCGLNTFGIYTDVAHHLKWLANYVTFT